MLVVIEHASESSFPVYIPAGNTNLHCNLIAWQHGFLVCKLTALRSFRYTAHGYIGSMLATNKHSGMYRYCTTICMNDVMCDLSLATLAALWYVAM